MVEYCSTIKGEYWFTHVIPWSCRCMWSWDSENQTPALPRNSALNCCTISPAPQTVSHHSLPRVIFNRLSERTGPSNMPSAFVFPFVPWSTWLEMECRCSVWKDLGTPWICLFSATQTAPVIAHHSGLQLSAGSLQNLTGFHLKHLTLITTVLVVSVRCSKTLPETYDLKTSFILLVLGARRPKSRCEQGYASFIDTGRKSILSLWFPSLWLI